MQTFDYNKKSLRCIQEELRRYCHAPGCDSPEKCPEECCRPTKFKGGRYEMAEKDPMLDLDTAIAWVAADDLEWALIDGIPAGRKMKTYDKVRERLHTLACVIGLHRSQYPVLFHYLDRAYHIFKYLQLRGEL